MSHILRMATVLVILAFAATGVAQAHPINYQHHHSHAGYAGPVYSQAPHAFNNPGPQIKGYELFVRACPCRKSKTADVISPGID
jgi:hypothetical protein